MQQYANSNMQYGTPYGTPYLNNAQPQMTQLYGVSQNIPPQMPYPQYQSSAPVNYFAPQAPQIPQTQQPVQTSTANTMPKNDAQFQQGSNLAPLSNDTLSISKNIPANTATKTITTTENLVSNENNSQMPQGKVNIASLNEPVISESTLNRNQNTPTAVQNEPLNMGVLSGPSDKPSNISKMPAAETRALNKKIKDIKTPESKSENGSFSGKLSSGLQFGAMGLSGVIILTLIGKFIKHIKK